MAGFFGVALVLAAAVIVQYGVLAGLGAFVGVMALGVLLAVTTDLLE